MSRSTKNARPLPHLTADDKWLRKARIDDWCARNRVERIPAVEHTLSLDELEAIGAARGFQYGRLPAVRRPERWRMRLNN